ncbi:MAG: DUF4230 domain-containing protein [Phycisphaerales bacterium JB050]
METLIIISLSVLSGLLLAAVLMLWLKRAGDRAPEVIRTDMLTERVRAVGKLVGLEVHAKEIATSKKGWAWLPPLLLSQAKLAMIFHFEKQYSVDLARLRKNDVEELDTGAGDRARFRIVLPEIEGTLRLTDVTPYDVQAGRILGLLDVIQMNAERQGALIDTAQEQAASLFETNEARYINDAKRSIERHLTALFKLVDADVSFEWSDERAGHPITRTGPVKVELAGV